MNRRAAEQAALRAETETSRHCSFTKDDDGRVVLHSAKHRNTVLLAGSGARRFLAAAQVCNQDVLDQLIEGYF